MIINILIKIITQIRYNNISTTNYIILIQFAQVKKK